MAFHHLFYRLLWRYLYSHLCCITKMDRRGSHGLVYRRVEARLQEMIVEAVEIWATTYDV
jgi:hypothetical protein